MAKSGFTFKQFHIEHGKVPMKVGTDSIALGSWVNLSGEKRILDIGCGSGLLAIMMAQKSVADCSITGIDVEPLAIEQSGENARNCPWPEKLSFTLCAVQDFSPDSRFDLIISNPPYFEPKSGELDRSDPQYIEPQRRQARHTLSLSFSTLVDNVVRLLNPQGRFCLVLPETEVAEFSELCGDAGLRCIHRTRVRSRPQDKVIRSLMTFAFTGDGKEDALAIRDDDGQYSRQFRRLCGAFYLNF